MPRLASLPIIPSVVTAENSDDQLENPNDFPKK